MATYQEIQAQIATLKEQAAAQRQQEMAGAIQQIQSLMSEYDISVDDFLKITKGKSNNKAKNGTVAFKDPESGNTWSGRGRKPNWLSGRDAEQFRV